MRDELVAQGSIFQTTSDTEVLLHLYARSKAATVEQALVESVAQAQGAFSLVAADEGPADCRARSARVPSADARPTRRRLHRLFRDVRAGSDRRRVDSRHRARRDAGRRTGRREVASAVPAGAGGALHLRARVFRASGLRTCSARASTRCARVRPRCWRASSRRPADVVVPMPDSGVCAATGYRRGVGHADADGAHPQSLRRPHVHRAAAVDSALRRAREAESGARASCRAGASCWSTTRSCVARPAGRSSRWCGRPARREVHMRISCPPTISPCFYGVDTPRRARADRRDALDRGDPAATSAPTRSAI